MQEQLELVDANAQRVAAEVRPILDAQDPEDVSFFTLATMLFVTVGVWTVGAVAMVAGVVYLIVRVA